MTKNVRVENADTSSYRVRVRAQYKNADGEWVDAGPEEGAIELPYPASLAQSTIHGTKRLIVEEY